MSGRRFTKLICLFASSQSLQSFFPYCSHASAVTSYLPSHCAPPFPPISLKIANMPLSAASMPPSSSSSHPSASSAPRRSSGRNASVKRLSFSHVEVIPEVIPESSKTFRGSIGAIRHSSSKLKRSPTPVLTSLTEMTTAHFHQLSAIWNETSLPSFESDKRDIAATRRSFGRKEKDPFDF